MGNFTPGIQTNFNSRIADADMEAMKGFGFKWVRQDALLCDVPTMLGMIEDAEAHDLRTLTILYDIGKLLEVPTGCWVEWGNELDFTTRPRDYRASLDEAAAIAISQQVHLVAPCISNLDQDSLRWLEQVRGDAWPDGMSGVSFHRYSVDGTFARPHKGFKTRDEEVHVLKSLCDGLPILLTEFGYKTKPGLTESSGGFVSEADQATYIGQEWVFWAGHDALCALLYQINDGLDREVEGFGIRRCNEDGSLNGWKPGASTLIGA